MKTRKRHSTTRLEKELARRLASELESLRRTRVKKAAVILVLDDKRIIQIGEMDLTHHQLSSAVPKSARS